MKLSKLTHPPSAGIFPKQKRITLDSFENQRVKGALIDIGATDKKIRDDFVALDIVSGKEVNVVADAHFLPFKDNSVAGVHINAVLEHVKNPFNVAKEIHRVLKSGGGVVAWVPFMASYHKSPDDYFRFTVSGIREIFHDFKECRILVGPGAFSALNEVLRNCFAIVCSFKSEFLYKFFCIVWGWILLPIKYLDLIFSCSENLSLLNNSTAAGFLFIGEK